MAVRNVQGEISVTPLRKKLFGIPEQRGYGFAVPVAAPTKAVERLSVVKAVEPVIQERDIQPAYLWKYEPNRILRAVCEVWNVPVYEVLSKRRAKHVIAPRHVAIALCCRLTNNTLPRIGTYFERDHSTIHHAREKMQPFIEACELDMEENATPREWALAMKARMP